MARGRPRKNGARLPSGQLKRPTVKELEIIEQIRANEQRMVVLAQPHRNGEMSQLAASPIGRFVMKYKLARECYDAAEQWAATKRKWLSAWDAPRIETTYGSGNDIPMEVIKEWKKQDFESMQVMTRYGGNDGLLAITAMAFDNKEMNQRINPICAVRSVIALAAHLGRIHPHAVDSLPMLQVDS